MKTSDASSKQPVQQKQPSSSSKAEEKPKTSQKKFQDVLKETKPKQTQVKVKHHFAPLEKKSSKTEEGKLTLPGKMTQQKVEDQPNLHQRIEAKEERDTSGLLQKKHSKEEAPEQINQPITPNLAQQAPLQIQGSKAVAETRNTALNVSEIESIVKQVQVGVNEKGLPEMNFELHTEKLGDISLKVNADNDKISIQFITQDVTAKDTLNQNLQELTQVLQNKGLNIAELDVRTRDDQSSRQQQQDQSGEEDYPGSGQ